MSQQQSKIRSWYFEYKEETGEYGQLSTEPPVIMEESFELVKVLEAVPLIERLKEISYELEFFGGNPECGCYQGKDILQDLIKELEG